MKRKEKVCIFVHNKETYELIWNKLLEKGYKPENNPYFRTTPGLKTYIWVNPFNEDSEEITPADNRDFGATWDFEFNSNLDLEEIMEFFGFNEIKENMNGQYYTECDEEFYKKLMGKYGFSCGWNHGWEGGYNSITINFGNKIIEEADNRGVNWFERNGYSPDYQYISNENLINLLESNNKKEVNMNKKIAIKVGDSQELSRMVQEFLFSKGYEWGGIGKTIDKQAVSTYKKDTCIGVNQFGGKRLFFSPESFYLGEGNKIYDAATQMGEIIALFNEPPVPEIVVENDSGEKFKAEFFSEHVKFGCAKIDNVVFSSLNSVMDTKVSPDSKVLTYIKIGRGKFSPDLIKQIVEHPHFGKPAK